MSRLHVTPLHEASGAADLAAYLSPEGVVVQSFARTAEGELVLERGAWRDGARELMRYRWDAGSWRALDRTLFVIDDETFAETHQYRDRSGTNLHEAPIRLPRRLVSGRWIHPFPGRDSRCALAFHGRAHVTIGDLSSDEDVIGILAVEGGSRSLQWCVRGIGEVSVGTPKARPRRWVVGAHVGENLRLGRVEPEWLSAERTPLPERVDARARMSLL